MESNEVASLLDAIIRLNPMQSRFLREAVAMLREDERRFLTEYLRFYADEGMEIEELAACYQHIVKVAMQEQVYFARHGRYRLSSYEEAAAKVYENSEFMGKYMHGLILTQFLWPNHIHMARWFVEKLPPDRPGDYLEIGPGHGYFFMNAMKHGGYDRYEGIDISPTSVELTKRLIGTGRFGDFSGYEVRLEDFLAYPDDRRFDAIVMGEVLEHVEEPEVFLRKIRRLAAPHAHIFVSTVINAPMPDHIYLFESEADLAEMIGGCGLTICDTLALPSHGCSMQECQARRLPVNIAFTLAPKLG